MEVVDLVLMLIELIAGLIDLFAGSRTE